MSLEVVLFILKSKEDVLMMQHQRDRLVNLLCLISVFFSSGCFVYLEVTLCQIVLHDDLVMQYLWIRNIQLRASCHVQLTKCFFQVCGLENVPF